MVLWGKGQTGVSCQLWEKGQLFSSPSPVLGPQLPNNTAVSCGAPFRRKHPKLSRGKQAPYFLFSGL